MSVYKEFYSAAHKIQAASKMIWNEAADWGVRVKKDDHNWKLMQEIARYFDPETDKREEFRYATGTTVNIYITVFNEWNGSMDEEVWRMTYTSVRNNPNLDGFVTIDRVSVKKSKYFED